MTALRWLLLKRMWLLRPKMTLANDSLAMGALVVFFLGSMLGGMVYEEFGKKGMQWIMKSYTLIAFLFIGWGILRVLQST